MKKYIIGVDLDGTLLMSNKEITDRTLWVIEQAVRKGNVIVPVTGRPISGIPKSILECKEIEYAITSNGAVTYNLKENRIIDNKCLPMSACKQIYQSLYCSASAFEVFVEGVAYEDEQTFQNLMRRYCNTMYFEYISRSRKIVSNVEDFLYSGKVDEISVMFDKNSVAHTAIHNIRKITGIQAVETVQCEFEIYNMSAGKGNALINLSEKLGFLQKEVVAIGDSNNDLDMMEKAGFSIAMENASKKVKKAADVVTSSNDRDGVAEAIIKFIM